MPYRRLPNTDQARMRALKAIVEKDNMSLGDFPVSLNTLMEAKNFLVVFEAASAYYRQCYNNQVRLSVKYQKAVRTARLYLSHFIQVLNLAVIRMEIKEEFKELYGLPLDSHIVPDLLTDSSILEWGEKIIRGEKERLRKGGIPIYNPTIAKVNVHYDIFKEAYGQRKELQIITARSLQAVAAMREQADRIILDIWNQVERKFIGLPAEEKHSKCREYGVVYYYRAREKKND